MILFSEEVTESEDSASLEMFGPVRQPPTFPEASKIGQGVCSVMFARGCDTLVMESVARNLLKGSVESWDFGKLRCSSEINQQEPDKDT